MSEGFALCSILRDRLFSVAVSTDLARHVYFLRLIPLFFFLFALCRCLSPSLALGCFFRWSRCSLFFFGFFFVDLPSFLAVFIAVCFLPRQVSRRVLSVAACR